MKWFTWKLVVAIILVGLFAVLGLVVYRSPGHGDLFVRSLQVILSWPVIVGLLAAVFGTTFRYELSDFISRARVRFPNGAELSTDAPQPKPELSSDTGDDEDTILLTKKQQEIVNQHIQSLETKVAEEGAAKQQVAEKATELLNEKEREVLLWKFEYLTLFLVQNTKLILKWLADLKVHPTKDYFHEVWTPLVKEKTEREAIIMALLHHGLIVEGNGTLSVTEFGQQFLNYVEAKKS